MAVIPGRRVELFKDGLSGSATEALREDLERALYWSVGVQADRTCQRPMSAGRSGTTIITATARDFRKLAEFRSFQWQVNNPQST